MRTVFRLTLAAALLAALASIVSAADDCQAYYKSLAERFAPVVYQDVGAVPRHDYIIRYDFDGDFVGNNNMENGLDPKYPMLGAVYGEVSAATEDAYYLFYFFFHSKDYEHWMIELLPAVDHENDFEGFLLVVDRASLQPLVIECASHNRYFQYANLIESQGTDGVDGHFHTDDGHPIVYSTSKGHGVNMVQRPPAKFAGGTGVIYRYHDGTAEEPKAPYEPDVGYELVPYDDLIARAQGPFGIEHAFNVPFDYYGKTLGTYSGGRFFGPQGMARPKPPWAWYDKNDGTRRGDWYFDPAYTVNIHFGFSRSEKYLYNHPMEQAFGVTPAVEDEVFRICPEEKYVKTKVRTALHDRRMKLRFNPEVDVLARRKSFEPGVPTASVPAAPGAAVGALEIPAPVREALPR